MSKNIRKELTSCLEQDIESYNNETDLKLKYGRVKIVKEVSEILRNERLTDSEERNKKERLLLDKEKLALEQQRFEFEKEKTIRQLKIDEDRLKLDNKKLELDEQELIFEKEKTKTEERNAIIETGTKIFVTILGLAPAVLYFAGSMIGYKLEYLDMGRTPSSTKDFLRKLK